ncbi:hypothetical protein [uncultured Kushneria sp.]|uniref:hypothetical protein n=1 Tax=uncultured Kushneria sp. TaxID=905033 RepID=UPI002608BBD3|nr:hypothetical protein [uncultured Kushneria sp.]
MWSSSLTGVSAISQSDDAHAQNVAQLATCRSVRLSGDDRLRHHAIHCLVCDMRLDFDAIEADFGIRVSYCFANVPERPAAFRRDGLIEYDKHSLIVTPWGDW